MSSSEQTKAGAQHIAIVQAAVHLLAEGGPQALRVRDIAESAGCTTMTVYSRFGGKDGVVDAIFADGYQRFTETLKAEASGPVAGLAVRMGLAYRKWALANPGSYQVMFTEAVPGFSPTAESAAVAFGAFQVLIDVVETHQIEGDIRAGNTIDIAWALWSLAHGFVMLELSGVNPGNTMIDAEAVFLEAMTAILAGFAS